MFNEQVAPIRIKLVMPKRNPSKLLLFPAFIGR